MESTKRRLVLANQRRSKAGSNRPFRAPDVAVWELSKMNNSIKVHTTVWVFNFNTSISVSQHRWKRKYYNYLHYKWPKWHSHTHTGFKSQVCSWYIMDAFLLLVVLFWVENEGQRSLEQVEPEEHQTGRVTFTQVSSTTTTTTYSFDGPL